MAEFWVEGGEYEDTLFERLAAGCTLERYGPFCSYEEARKEWRGRTGATIDNACIRYRVVEFRSRAA